MTIRRWIVALMAVIGGWLATLALVMVISDAAPGAVVLWPTADFVSRLPEGVAVASAGSRWVAVRGEIKGLSPALYRAGGRLVLPAGLPGCLPLPTSR